jgi:hypothetical protein
MRRLLLALLITAMPVGFVAADDGTDAFVELLRSDLRADKKALVEYAMELSEADAAVFWPLYDAYEAERIVLGDRMVELIKKYPDAVMVTGPDTIRDLSADWLKLQQDRVKLIGKYYKKMEKQLSPRVGARWMQVEHRIWLLVSLQLAAEVPMVEPLAR